MSSQRRGGEKGGKREDEKEQQQRGLTLQTKQKIEERRRRRRREREALHSSSFQCGRSRSGKLWELRIIPGRQAKAKVVETLQTPHPEHGGEGRGGRRWRAWREARREGREVGINQVFCSWQQLWKTRPLGTVMRRTSDVSEKLHWIWKDFDDFEHLLRKDPLRTAKPSEA